MIAVVSTELLQFALAKKADVMRYCDPERIQGYCASCEMYSLFWSCSPFDESPLEKLPAWSDAVLITQKTWVDPGSTKNSFIDPFLGARQTLDDTLKARETDDLITVIAGHCSGCSSCTCSQGVTCCSPHRMRYSLEGLGFDVTGLVEG